MLPSAVWLVRIVRCPLLPRSPHCRGRPLSSLLVDGSFSTAYGLAREVGTSTPATSPSNRVPEGTNFIIIRPTEHRPRPSSHPQICRKRIVCSGRAARASRAASQTQGMMPELTEGLALVDRLPRQPCGYDP